MKIPTTKRSDFKSKLISNRWEYKIPKDFILVVDTQEWTDTHKGLFRQGISGLEIICCPLKNGDYSIKGLEEHVFIERKRIGDLLSYIGKERSLTIKKLERIQGCKIRALTIEASEAEVFSDNFWSQLTREQKRQALVSFQCHYGLFLYYQPNRKEMERWILDRLIYVYQKLREV